MIIVNIFGGWDMNKRCVDCDGRYFYWEEGSGRCGECEEYRAAKIFFLKVFIIYVLGIALLVFYGR